MSVTEKAIAAVSLAIEAHREDLDADAYLSMIRVEVRIAPGGRVRKVLVERSSELAVNEQRPANT